MMLLPIRLAGYPHALSLISHYLIYRLGKSILVNSDDVRLLNRDISFVP